MFHNFYRNWRRWFQLDTVSKWWRSGRTAVTRNCGSVVRWVRRPRSVTGSRTSGSRGSLVILEQRGPLHFPGWGKRCRERVKSMPHWMNFWSASTTPSFVVPWNSERPIMSNRIKDTGTGWSKWACRNKWWPMQPLRWPSTEVTKPNCVPEWKTGQSTVRPSTLGSNEFVKLDGRPPSKRSKGTWNRPGNCTTNRCGKRKIAGSTAVRNKTSTAGRRRRARGGGGRTSGCVRLAIRIATRRPILAALISLEFELSTAGRKPLMAACVPSPWRGRRKPRRISGTAFLPCGICRPRPRFDCSIPRNVRDFVGRLSTNTNKTWVDFPAPDTGILNVGSSPASSEWRPCRRHRPDTNKSPDRETGKYPIAVFLCSVRRFGCTFWRDWTESRPPCKCAMDPDLRSVRPIKSPPDPVTIEIHDKLHLKLNDELR